MKSTVKRNVKKRIIGPMKTICYANKNLVFSPTYNGRGGQIVVSLTTIDDRIKNIFATLNSLILQTRKPDLIILWLSDENRCPKSLLTKIKAMGIEVRFVKDVGPHTKYYYAFGEYKKDLVITVDDDIVYHKEMVEELYHTSLHNPTCVIARRANKLRFGEDKTPLKYKDCIWEYRDAKEPSYDLLATGVGGVLYSPAVMSLDCWKNKDFLKVSPKADDIWLKFCQLANEIKVRTVDDSKFDEDVINFKSQKVCLSSENVDGGRNDEYIRSCAHYFGMDDTKSIPSIIHYCWLSEDPIPADMQRYVDGWKRLLPDYEFIKWDLERFQKESSPWVSEAVDQKEYAFASDYIRIFALYHFGGIYLDMDMELLKSFDDLLDRPYMFAYEREDMPWIEAGCFGAAKQNPFLKACLDYYENRHFVREDGILDTLPLSRVMGEILEQTKMNIEIFPWQYFTAKSYETGCEYPNENTYAIHHFAGSWKSEKERSVIEKARKIRNAHPLIGGYIAFVYEKTYKTKVAFKSGRVKELCYRIRQYRKRK